MQRRLLFIIALSLIAIAAIFAWKYQAAVYAKLAELKLVPLEERLTELYLNTDAFSLPEAVVPARTASFSFTIHNLEGQDTDYPYLVRVQYDGKASSTVESAVIRIKDKEYATLKKAYIFTASAKRVVIFIELPDQKQGIHFAVPRAD